jgi:hypothetical protein
LPNAKRRDDCPGVLLLSSSDFYQRRHSPDEMIPKPALFASQALGKVWVRPPRWPQTGRYSRVQMPPG